VKVRDRKADVFYVFRVELNQLGNGYSSPAGVFLGLAFGVFLTLAVAVFTGDLGEVRPYFVAGALAFLVLTIVLLVTYVRELFAANGLVKDITKEDRKIG
jgi:hypothetical protein